jgi:hypothetical protein
MVLAAEQLYRYLHLYREESKGLSILKGDLIRGTGGRRFGRRDLVCITTLRGGLARSAPFLRGGAFLWLLPRLPEFLEHLGFGGDPIKNPSNPLRIESLK